MDSANLPLSKRFSPPTPVRMTDPPTARRNTAGDDPRVVKFGGTSMGTGQRIRHAAQLVADGPGRAVVVVSAMSGVTSLLERALFGEADSGPSSDSDGPSPGATSAPGLIESLLERHLTAAREIAGDSELGSSATEARLRARLDRLRNALADPPGPSDDIRSTGEDLSVELMAAALEREGRRAEVVDARELVRTDDREGRAIPDDEATVALARARLLPLVADGVIPVIQGFVGATADGRTTTLGRGGSDFTAAIIGAALGAPEVTIWTDVDGIFSADPNRIPDARVIPELGYEEAVELAWFGARVIHPAAAKHAVGHRVALRIRNSFNPSHPGTLIRIDRRGAPGVAALAFKDRVALLTVRSRPMFMAWGFLARVFEVLTRNRVPVDLVATSHTSTAFTVDRDAPLDRVIAELDAFAEVDVRTDVGTVSAIGAGLLRMPGIAGDVFRTLDDLPIHLISQATDTSLSFVVDEDQGAAAVSRLHRALIAHP